MYVVASSPLWWGVGVLVVFDAAHECIYIYIHIKNRTYVSYRFAIGTI